MKIGVSGIGLQKYVNQTQKATYLWGFSQIGILTKSVEFRKDCGLCLVIFS